MTRRTIRRTLTVAVVVLLLAEITVRMIRPSLAIPEVWSQPELQQKFGQIVGLARHGQHPDVVLVGDSGMDAGGNPATLERLDGVSAYNASIAGSLIPEIASWTTKVVAPHLHPKVVVIGLSSNELNVHGLTNAATEAYRHSRVAQAAQGTGNVVDRADAWLRRWSMLYRYRSILRDPFVKSGPAPGVFDPALTPAGQDLAFANQGYLQDLGPNGHRLVLAGVKASLAGYAIGPKNVALLQSMILTLRHQGIGVLLVAMPVTSVLVALHPHGSADYQLGMTNLGDIAQRTGIDFVQPGIWPTAVFADPVHLNAAGAAQFSTYLAGVLAHQGGLPSG